jgi:SAM-dependent methyltransferase
MSSNSGGEGRYDDSFFDYVSIGSMRSAAIVAPIVLNNFPINSLVDIGCGRGAWLIEWDRAGVKNYVGVDGEYVDRTRLLVERDRFLSRDLAKPLELNRKFDLATSFEVGEHITPDATDVFVDNICRHSDAVLFSAAVPGQGGTFHVNEQTYDFWRARFAKRGYRLFDFVRLAINGRLEIEPWYRFNSMFFARGAAIENLSAEAMKSEIALSDKIPDFSPVIWRMRNAVVRRLPLPVTNGLVELKHQIVRLRSK